MAEPTAGQGQSGRSGVTERLRQVFISGVAITIPVIVTVIVLVFVVNFVLGLVGPAVSSLTAYFGIGTEIPDVALEVLAVLVVLLTIFVVGLFAEFRSGGGIEAAFDRGVARIPGVGSVYTSFNEMSELLLSSDSQSFREVKLVEFPTEGSYTIAFVTADAPDPVEEGTGHDEMTTLFMPMAPNPVMGGFVLHVSNDRVHDIDITVEEGIQSIVTSGVTVGADEEITSGEVGDIGEIETGATPGAVEDGTVVGQPASATDGATTGNDRSDTDPLDGADVAPDEVDGAATDTRTTEDE
jgi:uncharacterized membrane protein